MGKKEKIILTIVLVILFFIVGIITIPYSLGYRIDFDKKRIIKTGGIYLKAEPPFAEVFLNRKLKGATNLILGTIFIDNLLPKKYKIEVKKEGFYSWEKELEVFEEKVTYANSIILIPKNLHWEIVNLKKEGELSEIISKFNSTTTKEEIYYLNEKGYLFEKGKNIWNKSFKNLVISPDKEKIALSTDHEIWVLFLKPEVKKVFLTRFSKEIGEIFWYESSYLIFRVGNKIKITEIDNRDKLNIYEIGEFKEGIKIFFDEETKILYVLTKKVLFFTDDLKI